jgi:low temperature requirement protein LtrA
LTANKNDKPFFPKWFKLLWVIVTFTTLIFPLLFGVFYSYFTHTNANQALAIATRYTYPYAWILVVIGLVVGAVGLVARYGYGRRL